jgi:hypothetical protein
MSEEIDGGTRAEEAGGGPAEIARIEALERSLRRLWAALAAVVLAFALAVVASLGPRDRLAARELALSDPEGRVRIALSGAKEGGSIEHYDAEGRLRIAQGIDAEGKAALTLFDPSGGRRLAAAAFADADAGIALLDPGGKVRIQLLSESDGVTGTLHLDPQGRRRIETLASADGTAVESFLDPSGAVRLQLGTRRDGAPLFSLEEDEDAAGDEPADDAQEPAGQ